MRSRHFHTPAALVLLAVSMLHGSAVAAQAPREEFSSTLSNISNVGGVGLTPLTIRITRWTSDEDHERMMGLLREKGQETLLPIVVGRGEADAIEMRLDHREPSRPRVQELLKSTIDALGGRVVRVEIRDASEALYRAKVHLAQGSQRVELEARPSDSVVLALSAAAPIFAARELVREAGLTREDLRRMNDGVESSPPPSIPDISSTEHRM